MDGFRISCIKNNIDKFACKVCQFYKESCLIMDLCLLIKLFHVDTFCTEDFC